MAKCKNCKDVFTPKWFNWKFCQKEKCFSIGVKQAADKAKIEIDKKDRAETKKAKEKLLTHKDYLKLLQTVFNTFIRLRDKDLPCISCGKNNDKQYHAGHYRSVGSSPELRFNELNVWKQCASCNTYLHGNLIEYRKELIKRIGVDKVEWIEGHHKSNKMLIPEIKEQIKLYKHKIKELK
tara:strand:+ start:18972 stop:19511 length:540 start_codon:yes stop_codon:yes gene_type:complete